MRKQIIDIVRESGIIQNYRHIVLGLSGGPDSMCLFDVLMRLCEETDLRIWPVHVNHMLRPGAADRDQDFVQAACEERGVPLKVVKFDCTAMAQNQGLTSEEAGRIARYEAFRDMASRVQRAVQRGEAESGNIAIALAHHADDQAETILQRIIRGTGTDGLVGMEPVRDDESGFDILRPLLNVRRAEIEAYCASRDLHPCVDHTNSEPVYARNRIRLELMPMLERFNPRIVEAVDRLGQIAAEDKAFLDGQAAAAADRHRISADPSARRATDPSARRATTPAPGTLLTQAPGASLTQAPGASPTPAPGASPTPAPGTPLTQIAFHIELLEEHPAISRRVLSKALAELGLREDLTYAHYQAMLALGDSDRASAQVDLPDGYRARKEYHHIVLLAPACATERNLVEEESQLGDSLDLARDPDDNAGLVQRSLLQVRVMSIADYMALSTNSNGTCYAAFDYDVLTARCGGAPERMIIWRTRRPGDVLPIRGGRKKLQDVFVDDKVPRFRREEVWLAAIGSEVLWIPVQEGFVQRARYAAGYGVIAETKKVLVLERSVDL